MALNAKGPAIVTIPRARATKQGSKKDWRLLNHTQVILLDGTDSKLGVPVNTDKEDARKVPHDFRGIHSSPNNLQPHLRILLDDLGILV